MKNKSKKISLICLIISILIFVGLTIWVKTDSINSFDSAFYNIFLFNDITTFIMKVITTLGDELIFIPLVILCLVFIKDKNIGVYLLFNLILSSSLNAFTKLLIQRPRPVGISLVVENGFSFPSGHSFTAFAFYGFLIYLIYKFVKKSKPKILLIALISSLIILVGVSRVYLGVHFISDVIAAFAYGYIYLYFFVKLFDKYKIVNVRKIRKK